MACVGVLALGYSYGKMLPMFEGNKNVVSAVEFLREAKAKKGEVKVPSNVLVIGGGDVAMDVVTTLKLIGVEHVTDVVYEQFKEFKASKKELEGAQKMGVTIIDGYVPSYVEGNVVVFTHRGRRAGSDTSTPGRRAAPSPASRLRAPRSPP